MPTFITVLVVVLATAGCSRGRTGATTEPATPLGTASMRTPEQTANFEFLSSLQERITIKLDARGYDALTEGEKTLDCVWSLEAEVNNGGFHQYFFNSAGDRAADAPDSLRRIGAPKMADIVRRAIATLPQPVSQARAARQDQLESLSERDLSVLDSLDEEFFKYPEDLEQLLAAYARGNLDQFSGDVRPPN